MRMVILDGEKITGREQLHATLARELRFPDWYGGNLDALYDCLTDLREPTALQIVHQEALWERLGPETHGLLRVLRDAAKENPELYVEL